MRRTWIAPAVLSLASAAWVHAQPPPVETVTTTRELESRFELTEDFIRNDWRHPIRGLKVNILGAGPVHGAQADCEIHIGADLDDPTISDFPSIVLEPPNICKDKTKTFKGWRDFFNTMKTQTCDADGFIRVWPEHLDSGQGESNPRHFMELHPLRRLACPAASIGFKDKLKAFSDLGYKDATLVSTILRSFRLWVRKRPHPDFATLTSVSYSYWLCRDLEGQSCGSRILVPNFARLEAHVLRNTIRSVPAGAGEETFKTVIARSRPFPDEELPDPRRFLTKLYAVDGTDFFAHLGGSNEDFDVLGIFTIDPLSVIKALDKALDKIVELGTEDWVEVPYPIAFIIFGEMPVE